MDVKNALELKSGLNGLKFILSAAVVVLGHQLAMVQELVPLFPDLGVLTTIATFIAKALTVAADPTILLGSLGMFGGLLHKVIKLFYK